MVYDFCGYATRNNVKCSDGRTILKDAFRDDDGKKVPLVWNHQHNSPENVLGHALLENRDDGVYAYATFNDNESGRIAKELVKHGDISALSIYANKLQEQAGRVMHGVIREVSLVYAGANPEALIDSFIAHSDGSVTEDRNQGWFYSGLEGELYHADAEDTENEDEDEDDRRMKRIEAAMERKKAAEDKDEDPEDEAEDKSDDDEDKPNSESEEDDTKDQSESEDKDEDKEVKHADTEDVPDKSEIDKIMDSFTEEQKVFVMAMLEHALESADSNKSEEENKEEKTMRHNAFDKETQENENVLSHSDETKILDMAKSTSVGSLKAAIKMFCDDASLSHGFDTSSLTILFPEVTDIKPGAPEMLTTDQGWITKLLNKVHKSPLTHVRVRFTDVRNIENLRAKGYKKGEQKTLTGDVSVLYRTTDPQTIYVRSDLPRDDVLDIQDFDYVAYMYNIDRMNLNEELATAILLGDGRDIGDQYKIKEDKIIPVWTDSELFTIHRTVDFAAMKAQLQGSSTSNYFGDDFVYAETFVQELLYGREDAKNVGVGDLYIAPHVLNTMLLARDRNGRRIYNTVEELRSALNVNSIITVEQFEGKTRTVKEGEEKSLLAILFDAKNYQLGAAKGGEITHFTDFDINFNTLQSLLETRTSGMNTRPLSALVLEETVSGT